MTNPLRTTGMSQRQSIKKFLEDGYSLTALEALSLFGAYRLAAHVEVLRKQGMPIHTEMNKDVTGRTYARYTLRMTATEVSTRWNREPSIFNYQEELALHAH